MYNPNYVPAPTQIKVTFGFVWAFMWRAWLISAVIGGVVGLIAFILSAACGLALGSNFFN